MPLPLASKSAVDLARAGDDLVLTVGGNRRVLTLPSVLRRFVVVGADFDDGELRVRFAPDPALWPDAAGTGGDKDRRTHRRSGRSAGEADD
jgi:arsenite-transporting ATPase